MKKLILLALLAVIMVGCVKTKENGEPIVSDYYRQHSVDNPYLQVLDSCEYVCWNGRMAHKGKCKFCEAQRRTA
jgi:hypothetical protein